MIEIICADSMKLLPAMLERTQGFHMIFLDPTFFDWQTGRPGDVKPSHTDLSYYAYSLLRPNGTVFLCGTQPQLINDWRYWARFFKFSFEIIQAKNVGTPAISSRRPIATHENIWCLYRKLDSFNRLHLNMDRITEKGKVIHTDKVARRMHIRYGNEWKEWRTGVGYPKSVFQCNRIDGRNPEYVGHPTQKPIELITLLVAMSTDPDDWILDPFAGSGTTLVVSQRLDRNCIGIEIDKEYVQIIKKRLVEDWSKTSLKMWMNKT